MTERFIEKAGYCGPATLQFALKQKGIEISQDQLAKNMSWKKESGVSPEAMFMEASKYRPSKASENSNLIKLSSQIQHQIVVDWMSGENYEQDGHYSLIKQIYPDYIIMIDPSRGTVRMSRNKFEKRWWDVRTDSSVVVRWSLVIK